ncbi:MAG: exo-alpha-sialidase [Sphingobacterium sp.]|nr:exo-alpha-sialidase [Sphingobacterium sp.]
MDGARRGRPSGTAADGAARALLESRSLPSDRQALLLLFYKVGPSPAKWRGPDDPVPSTTGGPGPRRSRLPEGILGPRQEPPDRARPTGRSSAAAPRSATAGASISRRPMDRGATWTGDASDQRRTRRRAHPARRSCGTGAGGIVALMRSDAGRIYESRSVDGGASLAAAGPTAFPNPNSGIDAVTLRDGRHVLVYNPVTEGRGTLAVALSEDGRTWARILTLEDEKDAEFFLSRHYRVVRRARPRHLYLEAPIRHVVVDPGR